MKLWTTQVEFEALLNDAIDLTKDSPHTQNHITYQTLWKLPKSYIEQAVWGLQTAAAIFYHRDFCEYLYTNMNYHRDGIINKWKEQGQNSEDAWTTS